MPTGSHVVTFDPLPLLLTLLVFALVLFVPAVLERFFSSPGPSQSDAGDEGGRGPRRPPNPPDPPRGGLPLDVAEPARVRLRDHGRLAERLPSRLRRPALDPSRSPDRSSPRSTMGDRHP